MKKPALRKNLFIIGLLIGPLLISACGQKGPLYLPDGDSDTADVKIKSDKVVD